MLSFWQVLALALINTMCALQQLYCFGGVQAAVPVHDEGLPHAGASRGTWPEDERCHAARHPYEHSRSSEITGPAQK